MRCGTILQRIGTTTTIENPKLIMNPSISICTRRLSTSKFYYNYEYYYRGSSGPTPSPSGMLKHLIYTSVLNNSRYNFYHSFHYSWNVTYIHDQLSFTEFAHLFHTILGRFGATIGKYKTLKTGKVSCHFKEPWDAWKGTSHDEHPLHLLLGSGINIQFLTEVPERDCILPDWTNAVKQASLPVKMTKTKPCVWPIALLSIKLRIFLKNAATYMDTLD